MGSKLLLIANFHESLCTRSPPTTSLVVLLLPQLFHSPPPAPQFSFHYVGARFIVPFLARFFSSVVGAWARPTLSHRHSTVHCHPEAAFFAAEGSQLIPTDTETIVELRNVKALSS